mmetsp:Transcript_42953/g.124210  ORF Transcript_42953/g.124210 Transcript_42953/m.124210 type:complete len:292 (-) Transcript_42953:126-1001(-)
MQPRPWSQRLAAGDSDGFRVHATTGRDQREHGQAVAGGGCRRIVAAAGSASAAGQAASTGAAAIAGASWPTVGAAPAQGGSAAVADKAAAPPRASGAQLLDASAAAAADPPAAAAEAAAGAPAWQPVVDREPAGRRRRVAAFAALAAFTALTALPRCRLAVLFTGSDAASGGALPHTPGSDGPHGLVDVASGDASFAVDVAGAGHDSFRGTSIGGGGAGEAQRLFPRAAAMHRERGDSCAFAALRRQSQAGASGARARCVRRELLRCVFFKFGFGGRRAVAGCCLLSQHAT